MIDVAAIAEIITVSIAVLGAIVSFYFSHQTREENKKQRSLATLSLVRSYYSDIRCWADEVIERLIEAIHLCDLKPEELSSEDFSRLQHSVKVKLSALIDRGKIFLPNSDIELYGSWKTFASQGLRQPALDDIVDCYDLVDQIDIEKPSRNSELRNTMLHLEKKFLGRIQEILEVRTRIREIEKLTGRKSIELDRLKGRRLASQQ